MGNKLLCRFISESIRLEDLQSLAKRKCEESAAAKLKKYSNKQVEVHLIDGKTIQGVLSRVDEELLNIFLEDAKDSYGRYLPAVFVSGSSISYISVLPSSGDVEEQGLEEKVLELLRGNSDLSIAEIAKLLNESPSRIRAILLKLRRSGLINPRSLKIR